MVLAVNWPPQARAGQAAASTASSRASLILPAAWEPIASKTLRMVMSLLCRRAAEVSGAMEPPVEHEPGDIDASEGHDGGGHVLVAACDTDEAVEGVAAGD